MMALILCDECGKQISDKASHCVHCGAPVTKEDLLSVTDDVSTSSNSVEERCEGIIARIAPEGSGNPWKYWIRDRDGYSYLADSDVIVLSDDLAPTITEKMIVSFDTNLVEGRIKRIFLTKDLSYLNVSDFTKDLNIVRTEFSKSDQPSAMRSGMKHELTMPNGVWWFEKLTVGSIVLGVLFAKMPTAVAGFGIGIAVISLLIVFWASRGRSNFAKWLNAIAVVFGVAMMIPVLQGASMYGNPLVGNLVYGNQGGLMLLQTLMQISAIALLFGDDSKKWFEKQSQ